MRFFKIASLVLLLSLTPQTGYCQLSKGVSQIARSILKKGGKEAGEAAAKKGAKGAAKKAGESVAKRTAKELAGESAELAIRRNSMKSLTKGGTAKKSLKYGSEIRPGMASHFAGTIEKSIAKGAEKAVARGAGKRVVSEGIELTDRQLMKKLGSKESKMAIERAGKQELKKGSEKAAGKKGAIRAGKTLAGKEALKALDNFPALKKLVMEMEGKYGTLFSLDNLVVKKSGKHMIVEFHGTASKIEIKGNKIFAKGGSTRANGAMNEFLNNPLPNSTYVVDGCTTYTTDALGRTVSVECHSSKLSKSVDRTNLARQNQTSLVESKGGKAGVHDSGHIQQHSTGGNNEAMNLLPMKASKQRGGKWANMEKYERDAIDAGKDVVTKKKITYKPDGSYTIDVEMTIKDAVTGKVSTKKWSFPDLF